MVRSALQKSGRCLVCERRCRIRPGKRGHCGIRVNEKSAIYTLNYGNVSSMAVNPIEKKPLFHFYPGSKALTIGFWSCNFDCPWCQNHDISKSEPQFDEYLNPDYCAELAQKNECAGTSLSFNEPTLALEWGVELFKAAQQRGLYNTLVTNGYMTEGTLELFIQAGLDAANVDIKGDKKVVQKYCHADVAKVWRNCKILKENVIHLEITTLVIPTVNKNLKTLSDIGKRILDELGDAVPWHLTRYFPAYKFKAPETPIPFLEEAHAMAKNLGLKFVYLGNVPDHTCENTYCPQCGELLIKRSGTEIDVKLSGYACPHCKANLKDYFILKQ